MPQVHNKSMNDTSFGKDSRYMTSMRFSDITLRRVNVLNALESRLTTKKVDFFQSDSGYKIRRMDRVRQRLEDNLNKRLAYKVVLKNNSISEAKDYNKALTKRYSFEAFSTDVKEMMKLMKPDVIRERKTKLLLKENKLRYDILLNQSRQRFNKLVPEKKTWVPRHIQAQFDAQRKEQQEKEQREKQKIEKSAPLPGIEERNRRGLANLRRRLITIDSTPNSPTLVSPTLKMPAIKTPLAKSPLLSSTPIAGHESPVKTPSISKPPSSNLVKRQGITMNMMKKQRSFMETQERTLSPTGFGNALNSDRQETTETSDSVLPNTTSNSNDINNMNTNLDNTVSVGKDVALDLQTNAANKRGAKFNKNQPTLPPIESYRTPRRSSRDLGVGSVASSSGKISNRATKLPALKMTNKS